MLLPCSAVRVQEQNPSSNMLQDVGPTSFKYLIIHDMTLIAVGIAIANAGSGFVYGGGSKGLMGSASKEAVKAGAQVLGLYIPVLSWFMDDILCILSYRCSTLRDGER